MAESNQGFQRVCGNCEELMGDERGEFVGEENLLVHEECVEESNNE